jgi:hypothetical protein
MLYEISHMFYIDFRDFLQIPHLEVFPRGGGREKQKDET